MVGILVQLIQAVAWILTLALIADVVVSYFMSPFHPIRAFLDRLVQPMLRPIQRVLPTFGGIDFSPIIFLLLLQVVESVLINLLASL